MKFQIWMEGYAATGESAPACFVTSVEAPTFQEACNKHYEGDDVYDAERLTYWGCKLYDNSSDARELFG
jgi:hypothetical protein